MNKNIIFASDGRNTDMLDMTVDTVKLALGEDAVAMHVLSSSNDLRTRNSLNVIDVMPYLDSLGLNLSAWDRGMPAASLYKLAIPVLPEFGDVDRVIFMDSDFIIQDTVAQLTFSEAIDILFNMDISSFEVALPQDEAYLQIRNSEVVSDEICAKYPDIADSLNRRIWARCGTKLHAYGNTGFSLWSLYSLRVNGIDWYKERVRYLSRMLRDGGLWLVDRDFINVMLDCSPSLSGICDWISSDTNARCVAQHYSGPNNKGSFGSGYSGVVNRRAG